MADFSAQRHHFEDRLQITSKRLKVGNLARLLSFAEDLVLQQEGKREYRAKSHADRSAKG